MLNKFYIKFGLFCIILLLAALIIDTKTSSFNFPMFIRDEENVKDGNKIAHTSEYTVYVSDFNHLIFPINIVANEDEKFVSYYKDKVHNETDQNVYMTFSFLTIYSNYLPLGVQTFVPQSTQLLDYKIEDHVLTLYVTKDFENYDKQHEKEMFKIISSSFLAISDSFNSIVIDYNDSRVDKDEKRIKIDAYKNLNVIFNTTDLNHSTEYVAYFYTNVNQNYYLVKASVYEKENELSKEENVIKILTKTLNIPVISFIDEDKVKTINKSDQLPYYQYYLTCFENEIKEKDESINVLTINSYEIWLK